MAEPYYCTATDLRTELGVDNTVLTDAAALVIIENAEDAIDGLLGGWIVDTTTFRKIVQANVEAYQWAKLNRATIKMCVRLYSDASLISGTLYSSERGPDFSVSGRQFDGPADRQVLDLLNQSGLRRLQGRATNDPNMTGTNADLATTFYRSGMPRSSW